MLILNTLFEDIITGRNYNIQHSNQIKDTNGLFIVQEHNANRAGLHWDLRIGKDDVLLSWATKKLPQVFNNKKIILFKQPDHNPSWYNFSGEIKSGYGKGFVTIYDSGKYDIIKWDDRHIILNFHGSKLSGTYIFIPYNGSEDQILFFKQK